MKNFINLTKITALSLLFAFSCNKKEDTTTPTTEQLPSIVDIVLKDENFSILKEAVIKAELVDALKTENRTVFAPNNAAFTKSGITAEDIKDMDNEKLLEILTYHVLGSKVMSTDLPKNGSTVVTTLNSLSVFISTFGGKAIINNIEIKTVDVKASNGVIHVIDGVIMPPTETIAELATNTASLSTLLDAVNTAELASVLSDNKKYFTVFAPTNAAFTAANLPENLTATQLTPILMAHLTDKVVFSSNLATTSLEIVSLNEKKETLSLTGTGVKLKSETEAQEAKFVENSINIIATNGVIHLIDRVLIPTAPEAK